MSIEDRSLAQKEQSCCVCSFVQEILYREERRQLMQLLQMQFTERDDRERRGIQEKFTRHQ